MPSKPYQPGPKVRAAIQHMVEGRALTQSAAARLAGMSRTELSRKLNTDKVQRWMLERATAHLRGLPAVLATARLTNLIRAKSEDVAARVSTRIAEAAGVLPRDANAMGGGGSGSGPVLTVMFKHMQPGGTTAVAVQIGASAVHSPTTIAQVIEDDALSPHAHVLRKDAAVTDGGRGDAIADDSSAGPGVQKTRDDNQRPPPHTREPAKGSVEIISDPEKDARS